MTTPPPPRCVLVCVGSELLRGKLNTHASHISRRLASVGLTLDEENTVSDELADITASIRRAMASSTVVLVSGGLGPTFDDLTREAAAQATGLPLRLSPVLLRGLQAKFRRANYRMPKANARQAYLLEGARVIPNSMGTAPGQWLEVDGKIVILLPGPPAELYPMLERFVLPRLRRLAKAGSHLETHMHFVGLPESVIDAKVRPLIAREQSQAVQFTILAHLGLVDLDIFFSGPARDAARKRLQRIAASVRKAVGRAWYGSDDDYPLEKVVGDHLRKQRATLATAESCTGGLLASRLTDIPGSSDYFVEGWIAYADAVKRRDLGVPEALLKKHGAVSQPVAVAMAQGARQRAQTTYGVGITGIAGPGGGTRKKPVGLVYIAWVSRKHVLARAFRFSGSRDVIRQRAVLAALDVLRKITS